MARQTTNATLLICALLFGGCLNEETPQTDASGSIEPPAQQNSPPAISGSPPTAVKVGDAYSFTPTVTDPDGDTLTFTVSNLPSWAEFDSATGTITGYPTLADVGVFVQIGLAVSDGAASASLQPWDVTVTQVALGSMTLSWAPPTTNTDGTPLTNLAGYRIYYGLSEGSYPNRIEINSAGIATYVIEDLAPATYYVVATSVNSAGIESVYSNVAVKYVN